MVLKGLAFWLTLSLLTFYLHTWLIHHHLTLSFMGRNLFLVSIRNRRWWKLFLCKNKRQTSLNHENTAKIAHVPWYLCDTFDTRMSEEHSELFTNKIINCKICFLSCFLGVFLWCCCLGLSVNKIWTLQGSTGG